MFEYERQVVGTPGMLLIVSNGPTVVELLDYPNIKLIAQTVYPVARLMGEVPNPGVLRILSGNGFHDTLSFRV